MIYISSNNVRHPVTKTFTTLHPTTLHSTSLQLSTLHFLSFKLHPTTLHYTSLPTHLAWPHLNFLPLHKNYVQNFYKNLWRISKFVCNRAKISGSSLHDDIIRFYCCRPHKIISVQHSVFLYCRQRLVVQQCTKNALLCFHCNNGYANVSQYYFIGTLSILIL
jgi:hypothetical protein